MANLCLGFVICFVLICILDYFRCDNYLPPTYLNSNVDTRVVCDYINESYEHLKDLIFDLDDRVEDIICLHKSLEKRLFEDDYEENVLNTEDYSNSVYEDNIDIDY